MEENHSKVIILKPNHKTCLRSIPEFLKYLMPDFLHSHLSPPKKQQLKMHLRLSVLNLTNSNLFQIEMTNNSTVVDT